MSLFNQVGIKDSQTAKQVWVDEFNSLRANPTFRLVGKSFVGNTKDTNFWTETVTGSGSVVQANGIVTLETGVTANSTSQYQTIKVARWVTGFENTSRVLLRIPDAGAANNIRNWGAFNASDGFFFQLNNTALNIVWRKGGVDTVIPQVSWNGNAHGLTNPFTMDTNFHIWETKMTYADIHFYIDHNIVHTLIPTTSFFSSTLDLPVLLQNLNSGGGSSDVTMEVGVAFINRTGALETANVFRNVTGAGTTVLKFGAGRLHRVILNSTGGTSVTIYDNTSAAGTIISTLTTGIIASLDFQCDFSIGLTIVTVGAGCNITVIYE